MSLRILLVDDNALFREAMRMFLELQQGIEAVIEVDQGSQVLAAYRQGRVDVVCMDVGLCGLDGVATTQQLLASAPDARVVGLSGHADLQWVARMLRAGALGYVIKGSPCSELLKAIRAASQKRLYLDAALHVSSAGALSEYLEP